ncbi:MAG: acylneuraminate cytidylyltransferase family protein [Lentimicrobiaceae bacterium]|nr:acylneuraminate cytidylyltransferase family protein [Lentimicrobiaceae bacterium]
MKPLVVIPARGGSKGVPRKNIKLLGGKPLIQYTIEAAREVFPDEVICVSTDDKEIKSVVESLGLKVPFLRPPELAIDQAGTYEVLLHAIDFHEKNGYLPDTLILLQPTSPFRTGKHIKEALELFDKRCEMVISVKETKSNPYYTLREENEEGWLIKSKEGHFDRRQDAPTVWELNGAIYIIKVSVLKKKLLDRIKKTGKYKMNEISSIDIDSQLDWDFAEFLIQNKK